MKNGIAEIFTNQALEEAGLDNLLCSSRLEDCKIDLQEKRGKRTWRVVWMRVSGALQLEDGDVLLLVRGCNPHLIGLATSSRSEEVHVKHALKAGCDQFLYQICGLRRGDYLRVRSESLALSLWQDYCLTDVALELSSTPRNTPWRALHYQNWGAVHVAIEDWHRRDIPFQIPEAPGNFFKKRQRWS